MSKTNLKKKDKFGGLTLLIYTITVIDRVWYWYRKKHVDQQNRIKFQNSLTYS